MTALIIPGWHTPAVAQYITGERQVIRLRRNFVGIKTCRNRFGRFFNTPQVWGWHTKESPHGKMDSR